jgi:hypothetical protein
MPIDWEKVGRALEEPRPRREFGWRAFVPEEWIVKVSDTKKALEALKGDPFCREAAAALFWQIHLNQDVNLPENELREELAQLLGALSRPSEEIQNRLARNKELRLDSAFVGLHCFLAGFLYEKAHGREDTEQAEERLVRAAECSNLLPLYSYIDSSDVPEDPLEQSRMAVDSLLACEIFRRARAQGDSLKAFQQASVSAYLNHLVREALSSRGFGKHLAPELAPGLIKGPEIPGWSIEPQEVVDVFEQVLRNPPENVDWNEVAEWWYEFPWYLEDPDVKDFEGNEWGWVEYCYSRIGFAKAKLGPQELWKHLVQQQREGCEERLRRDFFGDLWRELPEEARKALIQSEVTWSSRETRRRVESIPNEFRLTFEPVLWEMLGYKDKPRLGQMLWGNRLEMAFAQLDLGRGDRKFIADKLIPELTTLNHYLRRLAEHPGEKPILHEEVEEMRRKVLGIGCEGLLPRLLEIKRALRKRGSQD